jgi:hypothetical protein
LLPKIFRHVADPGFFIPDPGIYPSRKKNLSQLYVVPTFYPKIVTKLSKIWVGDPGFEIRKKPIPNPGVKRHRIQGPQHC